MLKNTLNKLRAIWDGFFIGLKTTGDEIFTTSDISNGKGISINQQVQTNRVSHALLRGEVTQEVEELRYRTYAVDRGAKEYNYYTPLLAEKREEQDSKNIRVLNKENLPLVVVQNNDYTQETVLESLERLEKRGKNERLIKIVYNNGFFPRYNLNEYTRRVAVRQNGEKFIIDLYVNKYPNENDLKSKGFVKEIGRFVETKKMTDVFDIKSVSFLTIDAFGAKDMLEFKFNELKFYAAGEFDGSYVISFLSEKSSVGKDLMDKFFSKTMKQKYDNKEKKEVEVNILDLQPVSYVCEECGKVVEYSPTKLDEMEILDESSDTDNTEYFDLEIAEQTVGKKLCKKCFSKYLWTKNNSLNIKTDNA